jgi:outer membrane protein OmpA-like peptidoglycan-associated protein
MKTHAFRSLLFVFLASTAQAQEATRLSDSDLQSLSIAPTRTDAEGKPTKVYTKAADPEKSRVYTKSAKVVITRQSGTVEELPYVALPILFQVGTADLLSDGTSAQNVRKTADFLRDLVASGASFSIEGHASAEGDPEFNKWLSSERAAKILSLLIEGHGLPSGGLRAKGLGSQFATATEADGEDALQQDRRVLVVRTK